EIPWAGAREYSTITNISDYALHAGHADCGQQTLLLIALLRMNGIPARWQSGMVWSDGDYGKYWNLHDGGLFYLEPYGWLPRDVTFGGFGDADGMGWGCLGGLEAHRSAFNGDAGSGCAPPKQPCRSAAGDSQGGEAEWNGGNLYVDQWDDDFDAQPARPAACAGAG